MGFLNVRLGFARFSQVRGSASLRFCKVGVLRCCDFLTMPFFPAVPAALPYIYSTNQRLCPGGETFQKGKLEKGRLKFELPISSANDSLYVTNHHSAIAIALSMPPELSATSTFTR